MGKSSQTGLRVRDGRAAAAAARQPSASSAGLSAPSPRLPPRRPPSVVVVVVPSSERDRGVCCRLPTSRDSSLRSCRGFSQAPCIRVWGSEQGTPSAMPSAMGRVAQEASISFDSVRDKNVMQLRKLNTAIFPVTYQDQFYSDALNSGDFTKLAYYNDICVGSIACRLEKEGGNVRLYIMTLGVLAPYRRLGIGSKLLQNALDLCKNDSNIVEVYLHVQINNDEAIEFYRQFGFESTATLTNYYKRIDPPHCYVLSKSLVVPAVKSNEDS